jgi:hypothetical protein
MLFVTTLVVTSTLLLACAYVPASNLDDRPIALATLQAKADQARPRDRCFLYAKLISRITELAGQQFNSGDSEHAVETLKLVQRYAEKIHTGVADDSKKLKNSELLMQSTSFRLEHILSEASYEDRPALEVTLQQLDQVGPAGNQMVSAPRFLRQFQQSAPGGSLTNFPRVDEHDGLDCAGTN